MVVLIALYGRSCLRPVLSHRIVILLHYLPNLLVDRLPDAIRASQAAKVYVCNVATQRGETDDFEAVDHVLALEHHVGKGVVDHVLVNSNLDPAKTRIKEEWSVRAVGLSGLEKLDGSVRVVLEDVVNPEFPLRHDPEKLAHILIQLGREHRLQTAGDEANRNIRPAANGDFPDKPLAGTNGLATPDCWDSGRNRTCARLRTSRMNEPKSRSVTRVTIRAPGRSRKPGPPGERGIRYRRSEAHHPNSGCERDSRDLCVSTARRGRKPPDTIGVRRIE
jgi:hypothetical protein